MRCFLAIELSDAVRRHLGRVQQTMRSQLPKAVYPREGNLHVTLKFLGEVSDRQLPLLCESMQHVEISGTIRLAARHLDCFPPRGPARIVVATMSGSEAIVQALHQAIEQRGRMLGFESEHRKYHAHVTLARVKSGLDDGRRRKLVEAVSDLWPGPEFDVPEFVLFESHLCAEGSEYVKLATFPLGE